MYGVFTCIGVIFEANVGKYFSYWEYMGHGKEHRATNVSWLGQSGLLCGKWKVAVVMDDLVLWDAM